MEADLSSKMTFDERQPLMKTTFDGKRPLTEDDLLRKTTLDGRWPLIQCIVYYLKKCLWHGTTDQRWKKWEILSAVQTGNRISRDGRNVRGIMHVRMCKKDDICWQRRLNHSWVGGGIAFRRVYPARAYTTVVVLVLKKKGEGAKVSDLYCWDCFVIFMNLVVESWSCW